MASAYRRPPTCSQAGFVANRLAGARLHTLSGGRTVVPLLHPQRDGLPFLLTLELHAPPPAGAPPPSPPPASALDRSLYALHYVLAGSGQLVRSRGAAEELQAGDSVLMHSGAAACRAAAGLPAEALPEGSPWALAELVAYMPRQLFDQQQAGQAQWPGNLLPAQQQQAWASMLHRAGLEPLLLPGRAAAGPSSLGTGSGPDANASDGEMATLPAELVGGLLAEARQTARQLLLQQGQGSGTAGQEANSSGDSSSSGGDSRSLNGRSHNAMSSAAGSSLAGRHAGHSGSHDSHSSGGGGGGGGGGSLPALPVPEAVQAAARGLASWWRDQQGRTCPVTKRTLAELTAFRLPNQTNRLAVQFDPFSAPQVPFISGIEVFERGHRTTPHVHPHAHELFFILAGEGTGFCGEQRFPVAAGDVVVFRPGSVHGIDNGAASRMYCLELMVPNEAFAEMVRAGEDTGSLSGDDLCVLAAIGCR